MINHTLVEAKFARIGARVKIVDPDARREARRGRVLREGSVRLDIGRDDAGEYFEIERLPHVEAPVEVLDVQPAARHLLLLVREVAGKRKFLCGHDERHWFVAAVPEASPVGTVRAAKEALKPPEVLAAQASIGLRGGARELRKNAAYRRQGEWFFLPSPRMVVDEALVLRNEPITRGGGGKPHYLEFCYRTGGRAVYVCDRYSRGVSEERYRHLIQTNPTARSWNWRIMRIDPTVYARGRVRHPDHRTITLHVWHQVVMNTENQAAAMSQLVFLD